MIIAQILHSFLFTFVSYILYLKYNNGSAKPIDVYLIVILSLLLLIYNSFFNGLSNKLFFVLLIFSFSILIIQFMRNLVNVFETNKELERRKQLKENVLYIQDFVFKKLFIVLICIYQLLLIWIPGIFEKMTENQ